MRYMPARDGVKTAAKCPAASAFRDGNACVSPPSADTVAVTRASATGANDESRTVMSSAAVSPGSIDSGTRTDTGSGDVVDSHRAAWRQNNSWLRSVNEASIRHRHEAS